MRTSEREAFILWLMTYVDVKYGSPAVDYFILQLPKEFQIPKHCQLIAYFDEFPSYQVIVNTQITNQLELKIYPP